MLSQATDKSLSEELCRRVRLVANRIKTPTPADCIARFLRLTDLTLQRQVLMANKGLLEDGTDATFNLESDLPNGLRVQLAVSGVRPAEITIYVAQDGTRFTLEHGNLKEEFESGSLKGEHAKPVSSPGDALSPIALVDRIMRELVRDWEKRSAA